MANNTYPEPMVIISLKEYNDLKTTNKDLSESDYSIFKGKIESVFADILQNVPPTININIFRDKIYELFKKFGLRAYSHRHIESGKINFFIDGEIKGNPALSVSYEDRLG